MFQRKFFYPLLWLCLAFGMVYDSNGASLPAEPDISSPSQQERTIYVSPKGSNSNSGTSRDQPLRTIDRATRIVQPEQVIVLLPGIYHESVDLEDFGSLSGVITIRGEGSSPKDRAVLDGQGSKDVGIHVYNGRNLIFENLKIRNYTDVGLWIEFSKRVTIRGNIFYHNRFSSQDPDFDGEGFGLNVTESEDVLTELNEAYRNGPGPKRRANDALGTGIDTFALKNSIIRDNYSHDNIGGGFLIEDGINVTFEDNRAEDNDGDASAFEWWDAGLWVDGGRDVRP